MIFVDKDIRIYVNGSRKENECKDDRLTTCVGSEIVKISTNKDMYMVLGQKQGFRRGLQDEHGHGFVGMLSRFYVWNETLTMKDMSCLHSIDMACKIQPRATLDMKSLTEPTVLWSGDIRVFHIF